MYGVVPGVVPSDTLRLFANFMSDDRIIASKQ